MLASSSRMLISRRSAAVASRAMSSGPGALTELSNHMRVTSEYLPSETATIGVWIDAGTRFENEENNGTAHFLEHMAFKGTEKRSKEGLEREVENMGAHLNAYTSREQTVYYAKVFKGDVEKAVDILSDILQNSKMEDKAVATECGVILREEEEVAKSEEEVTFDRLHSMAYQGSPLDKVILGSRENIKNIRRSHLVDYVDTHYKAPRMVLVGAGGVDHTQLCDLGEKYFSWAGDEAPGTVKDLVAASPSIFTGSEVRNREDDMPYAHVAFAFQGPSWTSGDSVPMMVLHSLLGSWERGLPVGENAMSRLCARAAQQPGLQKVSTFNTVYSDTSLFGLYYVAAPKDIDDVQWALQYEMTRCCFKIEEEQLERAKVSLKTNLMLTLDDTSQVAEDIGRQVLVYGRRVSTAELFARIDAVDTPLLMRVAEEYLFDREMAVSSMGPVGYLPDYNWMRSRNHFNRY